VSGLLVTLCFRRYAFIWISLRQDLAAVLDGLEAAWAFFGGVVKHLVEDNLKPVVTYQVEVSALGHEGFMRVDHLGLLPLERDGHCGGMRQGRVLALRALVGRLDILEKISTRMPRGSPALIGFIGRLRSRGQLQRKSEIVRQRKDHERHRPGDSARSHWSGQTTFKLSLGFRRRAPFAYRPVRRRRHARDRVHEQRGHA
jgi:hypothetical protein